MITYSVLSIKWHGELTVNFKINGIVELRDHKNYITIVMFINEITFQIFRLIDTQNKILLMNAVQLIIQYQ